MENQFPKRKILVVDDDTNVQKGFKRILTKNNYVVQVACDGEDALSQIADFQPHVILLDMKMPYLNGNDTMRMIKFSDPIVEVIIASGFLSPNNIENFLADGAFSCLLKPVSSDFLLFQINQALQLRLSKEATD